MICVYVCCIMVIMSAVVEVHMEAVYTYVKKGSSVLLSCPFKSTTEAVVWRGPPNLTRYSDNSLKNSRLDNTNRISIYGDPTAGEYNLEIRNISVDDKGLYQCGTVKSGLVVVHDIEVLLAEPPKQMTVTNTTLQGLLMGMEKSWISLECIVDCGIPLGNISWVIKGVILSSEQSCVLIKRFYAKREDHMKKFTCVANNGWYIIERSVQLSLFLLPLVKVHKHPESDIEVGHDLRLSCHNETNLPPQNFVWERDGNKLFDHTSSILLIKNVTKNLSGTYTCRITNLAGEGSDSIHIDIYYKPYPVNGNQKFIFEAELGSPTNVSIAIGSIVEPEIAWMTTIGGKLGRWKVKKIEKSIYVAHSTIVPRIEDHFKTYKLKARNNVGSLDLELNLVSFAVAVKPENGTCEVSTVFSIECEINAENLSLWSSKWIHSHNDRVIREELGDTQGNRTLLKILYCDYADSGKYTCLWSSGKQHYSASSFIYVEGPPIFAEKNVIANKNVFQLEVKFHSNPAPDIIVWFTNDRKAKESAIIYELTQTLVELEVYGVRISRAGFMTFIQLHLPIQDDIEQFTCLVGNLFGNMEASFDRRFVEYNIVNQTTSSSSKKNGVSHLYVYIAIGGLCSFLLIAVLVYFLIGYHKKKCARCNIQQVNHSLQVVGYIGHSNVVMQPMQPASIPINEYEEIDTLSTYDTERCSKSSESSDNETILKMTVQESSHCNKYEDFSDFQRHDHTYTSIQDMT